MKRIYCITLAFLWSQAAAQVVVNAPVFVSANTVLHSEHPVENNSMFINQGILDLAGNWRNPGTYQGDGLISFSGTTDQIFVHNGNPIARIRLDATRVLQSGLVPVRTNFDLVRGVWQSSSVDTLLFDNGITVTGGDPGSFIDGPLHQTGTGRKYFPVGAGKTFLPLWLENVSGLNPVIRVQIKQNLTSPSIITSAIYTDFYWEVDAHRNLFSGSPVQVGFPANLLRPDYITLLHGSEMNSLSYISTRFTDNGAYWGLSTLDEYGSGLFALAEMNRPRSDIVTFYFPNTLSPHAADPENRKLRLYGNLSPANFVFVVFNRLGQKIFETNDLGTMQLTGWDGTDQSGESLSAGSYPYYLKVTENSGNVIEQKGLISLVK